MSRKLLLVALITLVLAGPAAAATVRVKVVDEFGAPVGRSFIHLQQAAGDGAVGDPFRRGRHVQADALGNAQIDELEPGHYVLDARTVKSFFAEEQNSPLAPSVQFTIDSPDQELQVQLELHRGSQLCVRFVIDGSRLDARGSVWRKELESGYSTEGGLRREEELCETLFAGRWELGLAPPGGYVLVDLDVNGDSVPGSTALLDVRGGAPTQNVTWYLVALAQLEGKVYFEGDHFGVVVRAELIEPGDWLIAAEARGGSLYGPVQDHPDPRAGDHYAIDLPDGRWRVSAVGEGLEESDPEVVEIEIGRGEQYRQDFTVRGESTGDQLGLTVRVFSPEGDRVGDAVVEVWPAGSGERGEVPLASERTHRFGTARITTLKSGNYRLVAGHPSFLEGTRDFVFDLKDDDTRSRTIRLKRAADLQVRLDSEEEHDLAGGVIQLTRNDKPLATELADERLLDELRNPRTEFDVTNQAWVQGIYAGAYTVRGSHDRVQFEFQQDGRWVEAPEIHFIDGESRELEVRIVPAATVAGQLYCVDGEPLPGNTDLRIVPSSARPKDPLDRTWEKKTVLERNALLGGERHDAFEVGPLSPADYLVAIRPATFDRWTWAYGTENGAEAQNFSGKGGEKIAVGAIAVDCAPALRVTVGVGSDQDAPDLSATRWERDLQLQATVVALDGRRHELERTDLERHERLLMLRGLHEGELSGELSLRHDYFLPQPWIRVPVQGELRRGGRLDVVLPVADVGGAIELTVVSSAVVAVRLVDADGIERVGTVQRGRVMLPNLPVGPYQLLLCADAECTTPARDPETVEVELLETLELRR